MSNVKFEELLNRIEEQLERKVKTHSDQDALTVMDRYVSEMSDFLEDVRENYSKGEVTVKEPEKQIIGIYDMADDEYYCVELENDEELDVSDIVFSGRFISFLPEVWVSMGKPKLGSLFVKEIESACEFIKKGKEVLIITGCLGQNEYTAYDASTKMKYIVEDYKSYKTDFKAKSADTGREYDNEKYAIYIPSTTFRVLTGIIINMTQIDMKMASEPWEERPYFIPGKEVFDAIEEYGFNKDIFNKAVIALNESFKKDKKYPKSYLRLEYRIRQLVRLIELKAPSMVVNKSYELIEKSLKELGIDY